MHLAPQHLTDDELRARIAHPCTPDVDRDGAQEELDRRELDEPGTYAPRVAGGPRTTRDPSDDGGLVDPMATER